MFEEYGREIIALIALVILFTIYGIIKLKTKKKSSENKKEITSNEVSVLKPDEYDDNKGAFHDVIYKEEKKKTEQHKELETENKTKKEVKEKKPSTKVNKYVINKRSVPPHGKITKDNFKEFSGTRILVA